MTNLANNLFIYFFSHLPLNFCLIRYYGCKFALIKKNPCDLNLLLKVRVTTAHILLNPLTVTRYPLPADRIDGNVIFTTSIELISTHCIIVYLLYMPRNRWCAVYMDTRKVIENEKKVNIQNNDCHFQQTRIQSKKSNLFYSLITENADRKKGRRNKRDGKENIKLKMDSVVFCPNVLNW